jgi:hypothetical protein
MAERAIFMLRDHDAANQFLEMAEAWGVQCHKLGASYEDKSLAKSAFTAGSIVIVKLVIQPANVVVVELDDTVAVQLLFEVRIRFNDELIAAFWFSKKLQDRTAFMVLTCNRIKSVLNGINSAERYSMLHAKAAKRSIKRESVLGNLDLSAERAAAEQERDAVMALVRAEMQAAML